MERSRAGSVGNTLAPLPSVSAGQGQLAWGRCFNFLGEIMTATELARIYERAARRLGLPFDRAAWSTEQQLEVEDEIVAIVAADEDYDEGDCT